MKEQQIFTTSSGHKLAYDVWGHGKNRILFFHGFPGTREQGRLLRAFAEDMDLEVVAFDRPGYGHSDFKELKELSDLSIHILEMTDHLGWTQFHTLGVSGGAPHAISMAANHPDRVLSLNIVCGLGPLNDREFQTHFSPSSLLTMKLVNRLPRRLIEYAAVRRIKSLIQKSDLGEVLYPGLDKVDKGSLAQGNVQLVLRSSLGNAFRQGVRGAKQDLSHYLRPWKQDWNNHLKCPVRFWHGDLDNMVPPQFMTLFGQRIPNAKLNLMKGEGHYSLPIRRTQEIIKQIIS